ncbi:unnamed protein product, partial [Meganyctiphanes norvegica]
MVLAVMEIVVVVTVMLVGGDNTGDDCPAGFVNLSGRCYLFSEQLGESPRTQVQAKMFCQVVGGDLATVGHSAPSEADPVLKYMFDNGLAEDYVYLGAERSGSHYVWTDGRTLSVHSHLWEYDDPDGNGEDCVGAITHNDYNRVYLVDGFCNYDWRFVCEKM